MTEAPQPDQETNSTLIPTQAEPSHDDPVSDVPPGVADAPDAEAGNRKQETMRDEIRAGWCRALRRGPRGGGHAARYGCTCTVKRAGVLPSASAQATPSCTKSSSRA